MPCVCLLQAVQMRHQHAEDYVGVCSAAADWLPWFCQGMVELCMCRGRTWYGSPGTDILGEALRLQDEARQL